MLSFFYWKSHAPLIRLMRSYGVHIMLDSGAYSAWKQGIEIAVDHYIAYIRQTRIGKYIVLDVVGDPEKSDAHLRRMEEEGLHPIPVFHYGTDYRWLDRYAARYPYIALGGTVGKPKHLRDAFFAEVFGRQPTIYYHGLGMTTPELLSKYPSFSIDSTTWLIGKKQGRLITDKGQIRLHAGMNVSERVGVNVEYLAAKERELANRDSHDIRKKMQNFRRAPIKRSPFLMGRPRHGIDFVWDRVFLSNTSASLLWSRMVGAAGGERGHGTD